MSDTLRFQTSPSSVVKKSAKMVAICKFLVLNIVLFLLEVESVANKGGGGSRISSNLEFLSRKKRNVAQLGYLVDNYTPYRSTQLLKHGNWCGYGGDRNHDGSATDACDACCKVHDACYDELLGSITEPLGVNEIISNLQVLSPYHHLEETNKLFLNVGLPKNRRCLPYVDLYQFQTRVGGGPYCGGVGGICSKRACACDMEFVNCLRRSRCQGLLG